MKETSQSRKLCGIEDSKHCFWIDHGPFERFWSTHQLFGSLKTGLVYNYASVLHKNIYNRLQCYLLACASWFSGCPHLIHHHEGSNLNAPLSIVRTSLIWLYYTGWSTITFPWEHHRIPAPVPPSISAATVFKRLALADEEGSPAPSWVAWVPASEVGSEWL